jgi:predicted nucleotidyltransferase
MELDKFIKIDHLREKMIEPEVNFLLEMKKYLGVPIYIYGSILRKDYFPNKSDIDISIFTSNPESTVVQLINFLEIGKSKIKIFKLKNTNQKTYKSKTIWGFKTNYRLDTPDDSWSFFDYSKKYKRFEISIFNKKYKNFINNTNKEHFKLPFLQAVCIYFVKMLYYYFFLNDKIYTTIKRKVLNIGKSEIQVIEKFGSL